MKILRFNETRLRPAVALTNALVFLLFSNPALAHGLGGQVKGPGGNNPGGPTGGVNLNLSSALASMTLSRNMTGKSGSLSLNLGGSPTTFKVGDKLTAAEYVAAMQSRQIASPTLSLASDGTALGGSFSLNALGGTKLNGLTVPQNVTGIDSAHNAVLQIGGSVVNYGSIFASLPSASLTIRALTDINNIGSITSNGSLTLSAGGSITNASGALIQARNNVNLLTNNLTNAGTIASTAGNVNIAANSLGNVNVLNTGGTISALAGAINIGNATLAGVSNLNVTGGDLLSKTLNIFAHGGTADVNVDNVTGVVNVDAGCAHVLASTSNLQLGLMQLSGDPSFYNTNGSITLNNLSNTSGNDLAIAASQDVNVTGGTIDTTSKSADGGNLLIVAGANLTAGGGGLLTINGSSATGGAINLTGVTAINTNGSANGSNTSNGGNVTMVAYAGTGASSGTIVAPATITTGGTGTGASGTVKMIAGANSGTAISTGAINTAPVKGSGTSGNVNLAVSTPTITGTSGTVSVVNGSVTSGGFTRGTATGGSATINGAVNAGAGNVNIAASNVDVEGSASGANVNFNLGNGNLTNNGTVTATTGNISINSSNSLNVTGNGGSFNAPNGAITFRDPSYAGNASINLTGDDYNSKIFNFYTGSGTMTANVGKLTGVVSGNACNASIAAQTTNLTVGQVNVSGDPTYSSSGDLTLGPNMGSELDTPDDITATAGGSIFAPGVTAINVASGDITMTANNSINLPSVTKMTATGNIGLTATTGSVTVGDPNSTAVALQANGISGRSAGDFSTGSIQAGTGGAVDIRSSAGNVFVQNITQSGAGTVHIQAQQNATVGNITTTGGNTNPAGGITVFGGGNVSIGNITTSASNQDPNVTIICNMNGGASDFVIGSANASNGMGTYTGGLTNATGVSGNFIVENLGNGGINVNSTSAVHLNGSGQADTMVLYAPNGAITLPGGTISSDGNGGSNGGAIWLAAHTINMNGTTLTANSTGQSGGNVILGASQINYGTSLNLQSNGPVGGGTVAIGGPGCVTVNTQVNQNGSPTSFFFNTNPTGDLTVSGSGALNATANGGVQGGTVEVVSQGLTFSGSSTTLAANGTGSGWGGFSGILASTLTTGSGSFVMQANGGTSGGGGFLFLQTTAANGNITVGTGAGQVQFSATGSGAGNPGGQINVIAGGSLNANLSAINLAPSGTNASGGYALLQSGTAGPGNMTLSGTMNLNATGSGNAGQIQIQSANGSINLGSTTINAQTGSGNGGLIQITSTGDVTGSGATLNASGLTAGGQGGQVQVSVSNGNINLAGGSVTANGTGSLNGGTVQLTASNNLTSSATVSSNGGSNGLGNIVIMQAGNSGTLTVSGTVSANGNNQNGGLVQMSGGTVNDTATISVSAATAGNAGSVSITSQGTATVGGPISANSAGSGTGGSVSITYNSGSALNLNSAIQANASGSGHGGSVSITDNAAGVMSVSLSSTIATTSGTGTMGTTTLSGGSSISLTGTSTGDLSGTTLSASNSGGVSVTMAKASTTLNVGSLSASAGNVTVNMSGAGATVKLASSGSISASNNAVNITTANLTNAGNINGGTVTVDGGSNATLTVNNTGTIGSSGQVTLNNGAGAVSLTGAGTIKGTNLTIDASTSVNGSQTSLFLADGTTKGVLNGTAGTSFTFGTTSGSYAADDVTASAGGITLTSTSGNVAVQSGGVLTSTGGNILINTQSGTIDIGSGSTITANNGTVSIDVGAVPSGNKIPTNMSQAGFTYLNSASNGKTVFFGSSGVSASGSNTVNVTGANKNSMGQIVFSGSGITVDGGVTINSLVAGRTHGKKVALEVEEEEGAIVNASYSQAYAGLMGFAHGIYTLSTAVGSIKHAGGAQVSFTRQGLINLTKGEIAIAAKHAAMVKAASCQIALAQGAFASISREGKTVKVRDLSDVSGKSVTVYFQDGHSLTVKPGQEVILTQDMYQMDKALSDGVERRRPAFRVLNNGEFVMATECHPAEVLLYSDVLSRMASSTAHDDHQLMANAVKTAAIILNIQAGHGAYVAPSTDHSKDAQLTAFMD